MSQLDGLSRRGFLTRAVLGSSAVVGLPWLDALAQAKGKTLTVAIPAGPTTLDPINAITHDPMVIMQAVFENLVE
jgi:ABC-type transport system substrate-binding protein